MDSAGLNLLVMLQSRMREHAGSLCVRRPSVAVRRAIELASMNDIIIEPTAA